MQVFHVTKRSSLASILKSGLKPKVGPRSEAGGEKRPAVFCFATLNDCAEGLGGWMADAFEDVPDGGLVVLKVDIEEITHEKTTGHELSVLDEIPVERITDILEETLKPSAQLVSRLRQAKESQNQKMN